MSARTDKLVQKRLDAMWAHLQATAGPASAASLSRSYGIDESKVAHILRTLGRLSNG